MQAWNLFNMFLLRLCYDILNASLIVVKLAVTQAMVQMLILYPSLSRLSVRTGALVTVVGV